MGKNGGSEAAPVGNPRHGPSLPNGSKCFLGAWAALAGGPAWQWGSRPKWSGGGTRGLPYPGILLDRSQSHRDLVWRDWLGRGCASSGGGGGGVLLDRVSLEGGKKESPSLLPSGPSHNRAGQPQARLLGQTYPDSPFSRARPLNPCPALTWRPTGI